MSQHNYALIMAGGSGSRLWPMSRVALPKQFQQLVSEETLFQHMVRLTRTVVPIERIFVMAIPEFRQLILEQVPELPTENLLVEPALRDNGPAITLGMLQIEQRDPQATVAILWSDHLILKEDEFSKVLTSAFAAAEALPEQLVTVGTEPTRPDPALGYIQMGDEVGRYGDLPVFQIKRFIEKPDRKTAEQFVEAWEYLWNVGYRVMGVQPFLKQFETFNSEYVTVIRELKEIVHEQPLNLERLTETYLKLPKQAIEPLLIQYLSDMVVVPADMGWSDVGTWNTLHQVLSETDESEMVVRGPVHVRQASRSIVYAKDRPIALLGVEDLVVIDTGDALLVMHREAPASELKDLVQNQLGTSNPELL